MFQYMQCRRSGEIGGNFFSLIQPLNYYTYWTTEVWSQIEACIAGLPFVAYNRFFDESCLKAVF